MWNSNLRFLFAYLSLGRYHLSVPNRGISSSTKWANGHNLFLIKLFILLNETKTIDYVNGNYCSPFSSFVTEISEHVKIKSGTAEEDGTEFDAFFPNFIWAIRDFTLELELDGKSITSDDYLEHALTPKIGN